MKIILQNEQGLTAFSSDPAPCDMVNGLVALSPPWDLSGSVILNPIGILYIYILLLIYIILSQAVQDALLILYGRSH